MEAIVVSVRREGDIGHARRAAASTAGEMGFSPLAVEQIAVVVTELATNLVQHHTIDGQIIIRMTDGCGQPPIEIISEDQGRESRRCIRPRRTIGRAGEQWDADWGRSSA